MDTLLLSKDNFLIDFLKSKINYLDLKDNSKDYDIVIFDSCKDLLVKNYIKNINLDNKLVVYIGGEEIDDIVNFPLPFKLNNLIESINNFVKYFEINIVKYPQYGVLNINKKHFTNVKNQPIFLTDKEIEVLQFLIKNGGATKEELFTSLWKTKVQNIKLVETVIYNIKQKFSSVDMDNFISINDGICEVKK